MTRRGIFGILRFDFRYFHKPIEGLFLEVFSQAFYRQTLKKKWIFALRNSVVLFSLCQFSSKSRRIPQMKLKMYRTAAQKS